MMWQYWWSLPGPSSFLRRIVSDLDEGKHVVLRWPELGPRQWHDSLRNQAKELVTYYLWSHFCENRLNGKGPRKFLAEETGISLGPSWELTPENLTRNEEFQMRVIILDGMDAATWNLWKPFLEKYADFSRAVDPYRRTRFVVSLYGEVALTGPKDEVCLASRTWDRTVSALDTQLLAASCWHEGLCSLRQKELWLALVTALGSWDPVSIHNLAGLNLKQLCGMAENGINSILGGERSPLLQEAGLSNQREEMWSQSRLQGFDGNDVLHPYLILQDAAEIGYRLWAAELSVLLPLVERERRRILTKYQHRLDVPFETSNGIIIDDVSKIEIGHLWYEMRRHRHLFDEVDRNRVRLLRRVRNKLAHFELVPFEMVQRCLI